MSYVLRFLITLPLLCAATLAITAKTDRIFNDLTPTEGQKYLTTLSTHHTYYQFFTTPRTTLSKIGLYITPLAKALPASSLTVTVEREGVTIGQTLIPLQTIPKDGPVYATFNPPVRTQRGEKLSLNFSLSPEADQSIGIQRRQVDGTFSADQVTFLIDGSVQSEPIALAAYAVYRPIFMLGIGWGFLLASLLVLTYPRWRSYTWLVYGLTILVITALPFIFNPSLPWLLILALPLGAVGLYLYLRQVGVADSPAIAGANVWALTTWWALQAQALREYFLILIALPYLLLARRQYRYIFVVLLWTLLVVTFGHKTSWQLPPEAVATMRDIFIDPYQVAAAVKTNVTSVSWDHFGSYIGLLNIGLLATGLIWQGKRQWRWLVTGLGCLLVATWRPLVHLLSLLHVPGQYFIIGTTLAIAYFVGWGLQGLLTYLKPGRLTAVLTWAIVILAALDLYYVWATVIEFINL